MNHERIKILIERLRQRAMYWRRRQEDQILALSPDLMESSRCANNAWGVEEAIRIVESWRDEGL